MLSIYSPDQTLTAPEAPQRHARSQLRALTVRRPARPARGGYLRVTLPRASWTVPLARRLTRSFLRHPYVGGDSRADVELALCEACSNAVRHAAPATHYHLRLHVQSATCLVEVADAGDGFDLDHETVMPGDLAVSGRGLAIIASVTDQLEVRRRPPSGILLRFVKHLRG
ncbi:ATP-binding protein [Micromonospora sp. CPCC 205371]|nr:ATP-binding protein [Micromonospora sp. CPCC 205371]